MYADKSKERFAQMNMPVDSILILRECCPHPIASRVRFTPPEVLCLTGCAALSHSRSRINHQR